MLKSGAPAVLLLSLIPAIPSFSQQSPSLPGTAPEAITSESLLQRAHAMLPALSPSDRLGLLFQLVNTNKKHLDVSSVWLDEAFAAASHVSDRTQRIDSQTSLLNLLSEFDAAAGLDKLATVEPPLHRGDYDPRAVAATWIFSSFYRDHPAEIEKIIAVARQIGNNGSYPFLGIAVVADQDHLQTSSDWRCL